MFLDLVIHSGGHSGRLGKGSFSEKFKLIIRGSICGEPESTGSKLQQDPNLISVPCSKTDLSFLGIFFWRCGKGSLTEKAKIVNRGSCVSHMKVHVLSFNMNLISFPYSAPRQSYPF